MIRFTQGNLLDAPCDALVNTVNEVGVMGKGIALMFREAFPENTRLYQAACKAREVRVGEMFVTENSSLIGPTWIINFPTKKHWRHPSRLEWIKAGLSDLAETVKLHDIRSVAVPPLGCGAGGLSWGQVRAEIEAALGALDGVEVLVFEPSPTYQNKAKSKGVEKLTPARALVAELVRRYEVIGLECTNLEVQKLAWFLQRAIDCLGLKNTLKLKFTANRYGPYADNLRHLLNSLDGSYLHCKKRLSDAGPLDLIWFDPSKRAKVGQYLESEHARPYQEALARTTELIEGFESPLGMELLATVDWLLVERDCAPTLTALRQELTTWPGGAEAASRKGRLFDDRLLELAIERLAESNLEPRSSLQRKG